MSRRRTRPAPHPPRFTYGDIVDPEDRPYCPHGHDARRATLDGWPVCASCRWRLKAKAARTSSTATPRAVDAPLTLDVTP